MEPWREVSARLPFTSPNYIKPRALSTFLLVQEALPIDKGWIILRWTVLTIVSLKIPGEAAMFLLVAFNSLLDLFMREGGVIHFSLTLGPLYG